jgi:hypothetical protein
MMMKRMQVKRSVCQSFLLLLIVVVSGTIVSSENVSAEPSATTILLSGERIAEASLATADFDGDGDKEIIAAGQDGMLYVAAYNGSSWSVVWGRQTALDLNAAGAPNPSSTTEIRAAPAVADLDGNGRLEIVVTVGGDPAHHKNGGVLVYTYNSSWSFSVASGWPQPKLDIVGLGPGASDPDGYWDGIWGSPALGDLDGDGDLEVVVEGFDRRLHAWHHDGTVVDGWPIAEANGDDIRRGGWSSPALGDIDGDGLPEAVFGTDSPSFETGVPNYNKATVWAVNGDSSNVPGFPVTTDQDIQSSPALGDIDGDGALDIVVGTGTGIAGSGGYKVYAWKGDGTPVGGWPRPTANNMVAPPALGDLDGDGDLEVVIGCGIGDGTCQWLYAWHGNGTNVSGFPMKPVAFSPWQSFYHDPTYSPVLADYDGDGVTEIMMVVRGTWGVSIVEPNGTVNPDRSRVTGAGALMPGSLMAAPVVDDVDNDGLLETLVGGIDVSGAHGEITIWDEVGTTSSALPWPTFHHDMQRTGNVWGADLTPPTNPLLTPSGHAVSTWSNDNTVQINLSGAADDESGVHRYYYAWDTSPGTTLDRSAAYIDATNTSITSASLADGSSHYFHLRTLDYAGNLATDTVHLGPFWIDAQPPASTAASLPYAVHQNLSVSWEGHDDAGASGLDSYDIQVRVGAGGAWTTWLDDVTYTQAVYNDTVVGQTYYFRSVARDVAGNVEAPPEGGDTSARVTKHGFTGHVYNNQGEPVFMAQGQLNSPPATLGVVASDLEGAYGLFFDEDGNYELTVQQSSFGTLPSKQVSSGGNVSGLDFYLPPADDFVVDGNFEWTGGTLDVSAWEFQGTTVPTRTETAHTGSWGLLMQGPGTAVISQTITLPNDLEAESLALSWMASVTGAVAAQDVLTAEVDVDGVLQSTSVLLTDMTAGDWTHGYLEVNAQANQVVTVRLMFKAASGALLRLDEVSLGETRPGVNQIYLPLVLRNTAN